MNNVLYRGTVKQVVQLVTQFKGATGKGLQPEADPDPAPENTTDKQRRLSNMEGVRTQRTGVSVDDDPDDFDGAFDKAASL